VSRRLDVWRTRTTCPHVSMVAVPDAGHAVLVERPAQVADVVVDAVAAPGWGKSPR
jgi:pimeloyl-ACP methyl ester carboxylesterase